MTDGRQDAVKAELRKVLRSKRFARKSKLPSLLCYIVEQSLAGKSGDLKEITIAMDVFGKPASFRGGDHDSIVRTNMHELRKELAGYYKQEGLNDAVEIQLKPGIYAPSFEFRTPLGKDSESTSADGRSQGDTDGSRRRYCAVIIAEFDRFENIVSMEETLRAISGDPRFRIVQFRIGSVIMEFECTEEAYRKLKKYLKPSLVRRLLTRWNGAIGTPTLKQRLHRDAEKMGRTSALEAQLRKRPSHPLEGCFTLTQLVKRDAPHQATITLGLPFAFDKKLSVQV